MTWRPSKYGCSAASFGANAELAPEAIVLILYGTGIRQRTSLSAVTARIGVTDAPVTFAGAQGDLVGLDQVNVRFTRSLAGRGEVEIALMVDGKTANTVRVAVR